VVVAGAAAVMVVAAVAGAVVAAMVVAAVAGAVVVAEADKKAIKVSCIGT